MTLSQIETPPISSGAKENLLTRLKELSGALMLFEIPAGPASVFMLILIGYFVMTVWFGKAPEPVVQKIRKPSNEK